MADITMCDDKKCPKKESCFRYKAKASKWQSWFLESPRKNETCEYYMKEEKDERESTSTSF